jgi:putative tricarboxylic transport membrane protein
MTAESADVASTRRSIPWGDGVVSLALLGIGVVVLLDGLNQAASTSASGVGAGFMPKVVGVLLIALSLALIVQVARGRLGEPDESEGDVDVRHTRWVPLAVCVAAVGIFIAAVEPLGYVIVSSIVFWLTAWAVGARHIIRTAIIAVALSLVVYLSFTRLLDIPLPAGFLGF